MARPVNFQALLFETSTSGSWNFDTDLDNVLVAADISHLVQEDVANAKPETTCHPGCGQAGVCFHEQAIPCLRAYLTYRPDVKMKSMIPSTNTYISQCERRWL